jgi:rhodanese-related sulfurtransferase
MSTLLRVIVCLTIAGALAGCGGRAPAGAATATALERVAQSVLRGEDQVRPEELAHWIVAGRKDFVLLDLRPADSFAAGHVSGAQHASLTELLQPAALAGVPANRKLIVYAGGCADSAASAALLRAAGRDTLALVGGYDAWSRQVLQSEGPPPAAAGEPAAAAAARAMACFFAGGPPPAAAPPAPPKPAAPAGFVPPVNAAPPVATAPQKRREGC